MAGEHLGGLVVADREGALHDLAQGSAGDRGHLARLGRCGDPTDLGPDVQSGRHQGRPEHLRGVGGRVGEEAVAVRVVPLVDPQRGDRRDHVLGDVARGPVRADGRPGERRLVEPEPHPGDLHRSQLRDGPRGERGHVGAVRVGGGRLLRRARQEGITAADEHELVARRHVAHRRTEPRHRSERGECGGGGEQLGRRRRRDRRGPRPEQRPSGAEVGDQDADVPAEHPLAQQRLHSGSDRGRVTGDRRGRPRDRGRRPGRRKLQPLRRLDRGGLGGRVGCSPAEPPLTEVEPVAGHGGHEEGQHDDLGKEPHREGDQPVALLTHGRVRAPFEVPFGRKCCETSPGAPANRRPVPVERPACVVDVW